MNADTAVTLNQILWACGGFATVYGVYKIWKAYVLKRTKQEEAIDKLEKQMSDLKQNDAMMLQTLLAILNHSIDGNGIEGMKKIRVSLEDYIVKK